MRIGIDIDDTISNTNDSLIEQAIKYDREFVNGKGFKDRNSFDFDDMFYWDDKIKNNFFETQVENIMENVYIKPHAAEVINRLKKEGHEIYIITSRGDRYVKNPIKLSKKWLKKNNVHFNKLITKSKNKGLTCEENKVDLLIDDLEKNCKSAKEHYINTIIFDSEFNKDCNEFKRVTNWEEVYDIITKKVN